MVSVLARLLSAANLLQPKLGGSLSGHSVSQRDTRLPLHNRCRLPLKTLVRLLLPVSLLRLFPSLLPHSGNGSRARSPSLGFRESVPQRHSVVSWLWRGSHCQGSPGPPHCPREEQQHKQNPLLQNEWEELRGGGLAARRTFAINIRHERPPSAPPSWEEDLERGSTQTLPRSFI